MDNSNHKSSPLNNKELSKLNFYIPTYILFIT